MKVPLVAPPRPTSDEGSDNYQPPLASDPAPFDVSPRLAEMARRAALPISVSVGHLHGGFLLTWPGRRVVRKAFCYYPDAAATKCAYLDLVSRLSAPATSPCCADTARAGS